MVMLTRPLFLIVLASLFVHGCSGGGSSADEPSTPVRYLCGGLGRDGAWSTPLAATLAEPKWQATAGCEVTKPKGAVPPGESAATSTNVYGDGTIWTGLYGNLVFRRAGASGPEDTVLLADDGSLGVKWWWRRGGEELVITGERLDGPGETLSVSTSETRGATFVSSGATSSSPGCWRIRATSGANRISFVTRVAIAE